eukprot:6199053-Pleurochrysis_carterae.AAC.2
MGMRTARSWSIGTGARLAREGAAQEEATRARSSCLCCSYSSDAAHRLIAAIPNAPYPHPSAVPPAAAHCVAALSRLVRTASRTNAVHCYDHHRSARQRFTYLSAQT